MWYDIAGSGLGWDGSGRLHSVQAGQRFAALADHGNVVGIASGGERDEAPPPAGGARTR